MKDDTPVSRKAKLREQLRDLTEHQATKRRPGVDHIPGATPPTVPFQHPPFDDDPDDVPDPDV